MELCLALVRLYVHCGALGVEVVALHSTDLALTLTRKQVDAILVSVVHLCKLFAVHLLVLVQLCQFHFSLHILVRVFLLLVPLDLLFFLSDELFIFVSRVSEFLLLPDEQD